MATTTILRACGFVVMLSFVVLLQNSDAYQLGGATPTPTPSPSPATAHIDCGAACGYRCSQTKRPNLCKRACGSCCHTCHCVPSGTSGHYEECPCYFHLTTGQGNETRRKCP